MYVEVRKNPHSEKRDNNERHTSGEKYNARGINNEYIRSKNNIMIKIVKHMNQNKYLPYKKQEIIEEETYYISKNLNMAIMGEWNMRAVIQKDNGEIEANIMWRPKGYFIHMVVEAKSLINALMVAHTMGLRKIWVFFQTLKE